MAIPAFGFRVKSPELRTTSPLGVKHLRTKSSAEYKKTTEMKRSLASLAVLALGRAEPIQYCRFGRETGHVDFCLGVTTHRNSSSGMHDLYLSLSVTRDHSDAGWTAVGTGSLMAGALMFVVYGDPAGEQPVLSIRT
ncbi:hypothetical protein E4U21_002829, partial [Claviceps maximensis]